MFRVNDKISFRKKYGKYKIENIIAINLLIFKYAFNNIYFLYKICKYVYFLQTAI